jgi:hypothetical protein
VDLLEAALAAEQARPGIEHARGEQQAFGC